MNQDGPVRFGRFEEEVLVIRHQHPRMNAPPVGFGCRSEMREQGSAVAIVDEDVFLPITSGCDVPDRAGMLETQRACHGPESNRAGESRSPQCDGLSSAT